MSEPKSLFDHLRQRFNEADGKWLTVSDQVDVLNLIDVAEAAQDRILGEYAPGVALPSSKDYEALRETLRALNRGDRRVARRN